LAEQLNGCARGLDRTFAGGHAQILKDIVAQASEAELRFNVRKWGEARHKPGTQREGENIPTTSDLAVRGFY
jgi:hypothetical protein